MDPNAIIEHLDLKALPFEGGYFKETYRSEIDIPVEVIGDQYTAARSLSTAIFYLLTENTFSAFHRLKGVEVFHFYLGDPVEVYLLSDKGLKKHILGNDLMGHQSPQLVIPKEIWLGARLQPGGTCALMGTTMAPGFDFEDFELGDRNQLIELYPEFKETIHILTCT